MKLGERQSFQEIYIRWAVVVILLVVIAVLAVFRYNREVSAIPLEVLLRKKPDGMVRLSGRVVAGTLVRKDIVATFNLSGAGKEEKISVLYIGKPDDNLRELKELVVVGFFDPDKMEFTAQRILPIPNMGFVVSAYLLSIIPLIFFLFNMERNLILLSILIKEEKPYQPEPEQ
jgi:cytochrome c-type biogenesis protein CcmE